MKFKVNNLWKMAMTYIESTNPIDEATIRTFDITEMFYRQLILFVKRKECININLNGKVRSGKSTVNLALGNFIQNVLIKEGLSKEKFGIWNICRSQYELSRKVRDPKLNNVVISIDEWDDLDNTGENITTEDAYLKHFSKLEAGRYIHRIYCSPEDQPDAQSDIVLNVIQANKETFFTHCTVYYRVLRGDVSTLQLIGYVNIDVRDILKNWVKNGIEHKFYNRNNNSEYLKEVQKWRKKDFYIDYMFRKFEKMDLLNEKGVFRSRQMDYAMVELEVIEDLKKLAMHEQLDHKFIINSLRYKCQHHRMPQSLLGEHTMTQRIEGVLGYWTRYYKELKDIKNLKVGILNNNVEPNKAQYIIKEKSIIMDEFRKKAEELEGELKSLVEIAKVYYGDE